MNGIPYYSPIPYMYESGELKRPQENDSWLNYLGIGAQAASPIATALLGRQRRIPDPQMAAAISLGQKPPMQVPNIYPQVARRNPILAMLLGGR